MKRFLVLTLVVLLAACDSEEKHNDLCCVRTVVSCDMYMVCYPTGNNNGVMCIPQQQCQDVCTEYAALERGHGRMCSLVLRKAGLHR